MSTDLTNRLIVIARSMEKVGDILFSEFNLTMRTYEILMHIHDGVTTTLDLSTLMQMTPASIAQKTKILEEQGLIQRKVAKHDKRIWYFSCTKKGLTVFAKIQSFYEQANAHLYSRYSEEEQRAFLTFLGDIDSHLTYVLQHREQLENFVKNGIRFERSET